MATRDEDFVSQVFVADTLTPMLFFSTRGMVYKSKVYRLPLGNPQARGKALINLLPLEEGETISTVMPLPEDESSWAQSQIVFATSSGYIRRNELSDFVDVKANGKIAMKLEDGDRLIGVGVCTEANDILLAARSGKAIRFAVGDVRVFAGRDSIGVRGIKLEEGDRVVSMSVLRHVEIALEERDAYLRYAAAKRRALGEAPAGEETESDSGGGSGRGAGDRPAAGAPGRAGGAGGVHPHRHLQGLRQAHLGLRVSRDRARRAGRRQHRSDAAQRPGGRLLPGGRGRPDHAGHQPRPADPLPGPRHPHRPAPDPGRHRVPRRGGRGSGGGGASQRSGRG